MTEAKTTINMRGIMCSVEPHSDGKSFVWRVEPGNATGTAGKAETAADAWGEAVEWAHSVADGEARDRATWDRLADHDLDASPEVSADYPLYKALNRAWLGANGLDGVLHVLRANGRHEEWFAVGPRNEGKPLGPYVVGQLEAAARLLVQSISDNIEDAAMHTPMPHRTGGDHA